MIYLDAKIFLIDFWVSLSLTLTHSRSERWKKISDKLSISLLSCFSLNTYILLLQYFKQRLHASDAIKDEVWEEDDNDDELKTMKKKENIFFTSEFVSFKAVHIFFSKTSYVWFYLIVKSFSNIADCQVYIHDISDIEFLYMIYSFERTIFTFIYLTYLT